MEHEWVPNRAFPFWDNEYVCLNCKLLIFRLGDGEYAYEPGYIGNERHKILSCEECIIKKIIE